MIRVSIACWCLLGSIATASSDAGEAALEFLNQLGRGEFKLETGSAISPNVTESKTQSIQQRLDRLAGQLRVGELDIVAEKVDGKLAAVLVSHVIDLDPATAQILAIGLIRREDAWLPAPMPTSFENTGIRYLPQQGPIAEDLEAWMRAQRPKQLVSLRDGLESRLLKQLREAITIEVLSGEEPAALAERFLAACRDRDLPKAAAYLGGLEEPRPTHWGESVSLIAAGFRSGEDTDSAWPELLDSKLLSSAVHTDQRNDSAVVSLGFFDPSESRANAEKVKIRSIRLRRSAAGSWRVLIPKWLGGTEPDPTPNLPENSLKDAFALALKNKVGDRTVEDPIELGEALMRGLSSKDLAEVLSLVHAQSETKATTALVSYSRLWREQRATTHLRLTLDLMIADDRACALHCHINPFEPKIRRNQMTPILMVRRDEGWQLDPEASPDVSKIPETLRPWYEECLERTREDWLSRLGLTNRLDGLPEDSRPDGKAARRAAESWIKAIESRDPRATFGHIALFDDDRSVKDLFTFIGQELPDRNSLELMNMHEHGRWAAASIRHTPPPGDDDPPIHLLHPIVDTPDGPKVLAEAVLYHADTRARTYLNKEVWRRLAERLPQEAVDELRSIHKDHEELCETTTETDE